MRDTEAGTDVVDVAWGRSPSRRGQRIANLILGTGLPSAHDSRSLATLSTRVLGHVGAWSYAVRSGSRWATALAIGSLASDVAVARRLRRFGYQPGLIQWVADALDAAGWGMVLGADPASGRPAIIADAVPTAADAAFTFAAGTVARPVPPGAVSWPPRAGSAVRLGIRIVGPALMPPVAFWVTRRMRGFKGGLGLCGWGISGAVLFGVVARNREAQQRAAIQSWRQRASLTLAEERRRSQIWAVTEEHDGHSFKRVLAALGSSGSQPAMDALQYRMARPSAVIGSTQGGGIVEHVARGVNVLSGGTVWLSEAQCEELERFLAFAEDHADGSALDLRVSRPSPSVIEIDYLGQHLQLSTESPRLERGLAPVVGGFLYATSVRAQAVLTHQFPWRAAVAACCIDLAAVLIFWRFPPEGAFVPWIVAVSALSNYLSVWAIVRESYSPFNASGTPQLAAGGPLMTHAMVLAFFRRQIHPLAHAASLGTLLGAFAYASVQSGLRLLELVDPLVGILMPFGVSWDLEERFGYEAALLDERLALQFEADVEKAHQSANAEELRILLRHVDLAATELNRLVEAGAIAGSLESWSSEEIERTRRWALAECRRFGVEP